MATYILPIVIITYIVGIVTYTNVTYNKYEKNEL